MRKTIISDTSCFIVLSKIGELDLLHKLYGNIITTSQIAEEFGEDLPAWVEDFNASFDEVVAIYTDEGQEIPKELQATGFEYVYDMASVFDYLKWINVSAFAEKAGINASLLRQYKNKITFASEAQKRG